MSSPRIGILAAVLFLSSGAALAQPAGTAAPQLECGDDWRQRGLVSHCEMKEWTVPAAARLSVDGRQNGGVQVRGWSRTDMLVRAKIQTAAPTAGEARALAGQIHIPTGASIRADGPAASRDLSWGVSYEIFVPHQTDLALKTMNGGVRITDVRGRIEFEALNGGVSLERLAGDVRGRTTNGGLSVRLAGSRWEGGQLDVETTNGGVSLGVPADYSARLETGTLNGNIRVDFPVTVQGEIRRQLSVTLGSGGPLVRAVTTNGGVNIKRL